MPLFFKKATLDDLALLVETRISTLREVLELSNTTNLDFDRQESESYYLETIPTKMHVAYLVFDGEEVVATGGICFYRTIPIGQYCLNGKSATIVNLHTVPSHRKQGIATKLLDLLLEAAKEYGATCINLDSTEMGKPFYEKYGFQVSDDIMTLYAKDTTSFDYR